MGFLTQPFSLTSLILGDKSRKIGDFTVDTIINEGTQDSLTITKQPVQQGASITDHAYKEPTSLTMQVLFKDGLFVSLTKTYQNLLDLQSSRVPIDVVTPKRIYHNMLISSLSMTTDKNTENSLSMSISFQEVIIVSIATTSVPRSKQRLGQVTGAIQNAGKKASFLYTGGQAIGGLGR